MMTEAEDCGHPILETIGKMAVRIREGEELAVELRAQVTEALRERDEARALAREWLKDPPQPEDWWRLERRYGWL